MATITLSATGSSDDVPIQAAIDYINSAGGGVLELKGGVYDVTSSIQLRSGVKIIGEGYEISNGSILVGGTILQGNSTDNCFVHNASDTTPPADLIEIYSESVYGISLIGMAFEKFLTPVHIGSLNASGAFFSEFRDLFSTNSTGWGFYFENCSLSNFTNLTARDMAFGAVGGMMFRTSHTSYNHGNSSYRFLFVEAGKDLTRGIVYQARNGSAFNDNNIFHIQCNTGGTFQSQVTTMVNGSADITVTDGARFPVDMPVSFDATLNGFNKLETYFVVSQIGNVIRLSKAQGDLANAKVATGSVAVNIITYGFPGVEVCGYSDASGGIIQPLQMSGVDIEGRATCAMLWQQASAIVDISLITYDQGVTSSEVCCSSICFRKNATGTYRSLSPFLAVDIQNNYSLLSCLSAQVSSVLYPNWVVQKPPAGMFFDAGLSAGFLSLSGNMMGNNYSLRTVSGAGGAFIYPNQALGQRCTSINGTATPRTLNWSSSGTLVYTGGAAVTWRLPSLTDGPGGVGVNSTGIPYEICNGSSAAVAIILNADTGDYFNNDSSKTSITLDQFDSISIRANYNGAKAFWQIIGEHDASVSTL